MSIGSKDTHGGQFVGNSTEPLANVVHIVRVQVV